MNQHVTTSTDEAADRVAIRELVEDCAHYADRRDPKGQMSLFTADTHFLAYMNAKDQTPPWNCTHARHSHPSLKSWTSTIPPRTSSGRAQSSRLPAGEPPV